MYKFSKRSLEQLNTCHKDIQYILNTLIKFYDFSVLEGLRTTERQLKLFREGKTKIDGVRVLSKHQSKNGISHAVDIMPYKKGTNPYSGDPKDTARFYYMMGMVRAIAEEAYKEKKIKHKVRFGLDWDSDDIFKDQNFDDLAHFELV